MQQSSSTWRMGSVQRGQLKFGEEKLNIDPELPDSFTNVRSPSSPRRIPIYDYGDLLLWYKEARLSQLPELKKARADGKTAYFSHTKLVIRERGERTAQTQAVSTSPAASVMTVTPAATFTGGAASVGAVGEASAGMDDDQREEVQKVAAQRKGKRKK
ncbi:hypothetical protein Pmani_003696 [Petrolisthes manimaculis]|uniref:Uncharacterized protein n=1 Tax=Petrolisthes manimaculis TaxID=1843537 RepID=A0AAE1QI27_9EUCA|nr:hypothetical protein Pmani_003696 [Petrolisthes manimaculis]